MTDQPPSAEPPGRLESWKEIAQYLKRDVTTVQRWEKRERMPVHRHQHDKIGSVYAFPAELDAWARGRSQRAAPADEPESEPAREARPDRSRMMWIAAALAVAVVAVITFSLLMKRPAATDNNPLSSARFIRLTDFEGAEQAAAISRDGRFVAFLADRSGSTDVWVTEAGSGQFRNLTNGKLRELVNPDIRTIGFSPDGAQVLMWVRRPGVAGAQDISIWSIPVAGGEAKIYLEGVAESDWSADAKRLVFHTPAPGDPMFVREPGSAERGIYTAAAGHHNHYPLWSPAGDAIYFVSGALPNELDVWRIDPAGQNPERVTSHNGLVAYLAFLDAHTLLYLATDADGAGPWLYALDVETRATRRVSFGVERYTSLSASADGRKLVVTSATPRRTLWRLPIGDAVAEESSASRIALPIVGGHSPRTGPGYLLYVSSQSEADSIWKVSEGTARALWSAERVRIAGGPAIAPGGERIALTAERDGRARLYSMRADGSDVIAFPETLQPRGAPAWSPDGQSLVVAATINGAPRLAKVSVRDSSITPLGAELAFDPAWSRDGRTILYSGAEVGTTFPLRAIRADGRTAPETKMMLSRGTRRLGLMPDGKSVVVMRGDIASKNFWTIDLESGAERQLTNFGPGVIVGDFDVSPDGREIAFDREQDSADVVLIRRESP